MPLHHRQQIEDIRSAYSASKSCTASDSDDEYRHREAHSSSGSDRSSRKQPVEPPRYAPKPPLVRHDTCQGRIEYVPGTFFHDDDLASRPRGSGESVATYASTEPDAEVHQEEQPEYEVPQCNVSHDAPQAIPSTSAEFSQLFPSNRRLTIRHDDTTEDGNMNLRVDTHIASSGGSYDMTLFHLRMHDLKSREFSLRRYCRDSGREVCHSTRRYATPNSKRPGFQRSLSNALQTMRPKSESRSNHAAGLKRHDSGYGSMHSRTSMDADREDWAAENEGDTNTEPRQLANDIKLEFSNYAQVDVKRKVVTGNKRYEFQYWGTTYSWKRIVRKPGMLREVSYHLLQAGSIEPVAYIMPIPLTLEQAREESWKGGWIAPCSMWIADRNILRAQKDIADVVVATGLMALVDDTIRMRFHAKGHKQLLIPLSKLDIGVEYVGPKRLINEMFGRKDGVQSTPSSRPNTSHRKTPSAAVAPLNRGTTF